MSTCISKHGEYSNHIPDGEYTCTRCWVLDEEAMLAELRHLRAQLAAVQPVIDAARAAADYIRKNFPDWATNAMVAGTGRILVAAVDEFASPPEGPTQ